MDILVLMTQYMFWVGFVGMAAATLYFFMEKDSLAPEYRSTSTIAALVTFVAAIHYYAMKDTVGTDGLASSLANFPTEIRYIDWLVTTPLLLVKFPALLNLKKGAGSLLARLVIADVIMIVFGYLGETSINAAGGVTTAGVVYYIIGCIAWLYIVYILFTEVTKAAEQAPESIRNGLKVMRYFILIGWAIYPIGYLVTLLGDGQTLGFIRELVYNFADLVNKVGFGLVALYAVKAMSKAKK
jgi:bacteriorhodopsin